jgi:hypothetical protein
MTARYACLPAGELRYRPVPGRRGSVPALPPPAGARLSGTLPRKPRRTVPGSAERPAS